MLAAGLLASLACAIVGCFLVLRRMSLMGDAISHAVLPGIVGGFLLHALLDRIGAHVSVSLMFFAGAVAIGVVTAALSELVHRLGRVEPGASMGVVFTVLFAIGVIMLEQSGGRTIHLDAGCVLYGAMEDAVWLNPPAAISDFLTPDHWQFFPRQVTTLALVLAANILFIVLLFKELRISAFDPGLAAAQGINPNVMHYLLMTFVAITTVASFEAVGSILVVAMLIVPGVVAHLFADRLAPMLWLSALVAGLAALGGFGAAVVADVNAAGMIGVALGVLLALAAMISPRGGLLRRSATHAPVHSPTSPAAP